MYYLVSTDWTKYEIIYLSDDDAIMRASDTYVTSQWDVKTLCIKYQLSRVQDPCVHHAYELKIHLWVWYIECRVHEYSSILHPHDATHVTGWGLYEKENFSLPNTYIWINYNKKLSIAFGLLLLETGIWNYFLACTVVLSPSKTCSSS